MKNTIALGAVAALLIAAGCKHDRGVSTTTTKSAGILSSEDAVQRLTAARCQREVDCDHIGSGKGYDDYAACEREVSQGLRSSVRTDECPDGIQEAKVDQCLKELKNETCGNVLEQVSRLTTCRTGMLCLR